MSDDVSPRPYGGFSLFGVPHNDIDVRYTAEKLFDAYHGGGVTPLDAMTAILNQNERVVSRCGMLVSFSGTLIALSLFIANRPNVLFAGWQQWVYYVAMLIWTVSTMQLLWSLRHRMPPPWEYHTKADFILTAELFLKRMATYNMALMSTIISFIVIVFILSPISAVISDKLFRSP